MKYFVCQLYFFISCMFAALPCFAKTNIQQTKNSVVEIFHNGNGNALAKISLRKGWHIYWSNPGEIGLPTTITAKNSNIEVMNQSTPQIHTVYDTMDEYIYENSAYFAINIDNPQQAELTFNFVECNDVCKPEKVTFNMSDIPPTDTKLWQQIHKNASDTFPQKIQLSNSLKTNEVLLPFIANNIKFIPVKQDVIDNSTIEVNTKNQKTFVTWQSSEAELLKQALIINDNKAYLADIVYEQNSFILLYIILLAFIGGIILNAMPCVFPILSLKIFSLIKQRRRNPAKARLNAFLYTSGVLLCFLILTAGLIVLKSGGKAVGWGFQLQSAWFVGIMAIVFALLFLYMVEWLRFPNFANRLIHKASGFNDFTTGFFAVLIASPCTGPFMGAAVGFAFMRSNVEIFAVFVALALGYALPYALIELYPQALHNILPKPGKWMHKVKIVLAIPVFLTSVWLAGVWYAQITDSYSVLEQTTKEELRWQYYDSQKIAMLNEAKENIFIDFTADWCLTCKFNEKFLINTQKFKNFVKQNNVHLFVADLTESNETYYQALSSYGRDSIPLYIYYHNGEYKILPLFFSTNDLN